MSVHYSGSTDGAELRIHENGTISIFGWNGFNNREYFSHGAALGTNVWHVFTFSINLSSQRCSVKVNGSSRIQDMPLRATMGNSVLFINTLTFKSGPLFDRAEFYMDDIFATRNSIDRGFYISPTISKTPLMMWQYLQVYPGRFEDLMFLSLINITSGAPFPGYGSVNIPSNGRIDLGALSNSISNFRIRVDMVRWFPQTFTGPDRCQLDGAVPVLRSALSGNGSVE